MNCEQKKPPKLRISALLDVDLNQRLDCEIVKRYQEPNNRVTKSSLINEIIRLHYTGEFNV